LLGELERLLKPDIVLIDSRAGLHDIAAVSLMGLADTCLLFGTDSEQTWDGYRLLFSHWKTRPTVLESIRERIIMVNALFPEAGQEKAIQSYLEHSYDLFSSMMYEEIKPGDEIAGSEAFNFEMSDESAPHYPLRILWNARFQEFSESLLREEVISEASIDASYGMFFMGLDEKFFGGR
jgi:hypothetical protein